MMTSEAAFEFLNKLKKRGMVLGLSVMRELTERLGKPQNKLKNVIHAAGTNGKGSVCAFIEAALIDAGYTVGRYSSPPVFSYFEIFRKNGRNITDEEYCRCMERVKAAAESMTDAPTAFEIETALAFLYFEDCDCCIIETGLGGREDATNVIDIPKTAVLTSISLDHMHILGGTVAEITAEKCGIFNERTTVISAVQTAEAERVIRERAGAAPLIFAGAPENIRLSGTYQTFDYKEMKDMETGLLGTFQPKNAAVAVEVLKSLGIPETNIRNGLRTAVWRGRFDILSRSPMLIADGAHNRGAFEELAKSLIEYFPGEKFIFITGVLADKEYTAAAEIFAPLAEKVFTITPGNPRALDNIRYAEEFNKHGADAVPVRIEDVRGLIDKNKITAAFGSLSFMERFYNEVTDGTNQ